MKHLDLLNEFRKEIAQFRSQIEEASAMQLYDTHKIAENVMCDLLREFYGWPALRNLNAAQVNFPGIDLADDHARIAVQITATANIEKIKHSIDKFVSNKLYERYDRLIVYVLTTKQGNYSQAAIDTATGGKFQFDSNKDIWDYQDLCSKATDVSPQILQATINHLKAYLRGVPVGLADEDVDPPLVPAESLMANLVKIDFPATLYIAQLNIDLVCRHAKRPSGLWRKTIRAFNQENECSIPSAYVVHGKTLITFFDLTRAGNPYHHLIESGTAEAHQSRDLWAIDEDHERVFKSLLRFSLQQRLFQERVRWENDEKKFVFLPHEDSFDRREETWQGEKKAKRTVFARQFNKKNPSKVRMQKHLSFSVDFLRFGENWFMSIIPNWFFSYGTDFRKSGYSYDHLSWIKRQENNQQVTTHFKFIATWLRSIDKEDLLPKKSVMNSFLSFGEILELHGAPLLDETRWASLPSPPLTESAPQHRLFD